jgi:beta-1,4-N-acetylglucosaminyltransferase
MTKKNIESNLIYFLALIIPVFSFFEGETLFVIYEREFDSRILFLLITVPLFLIIAIKNKWYRLDMVGKIFLSFIIIGILNSILISENLIWSVPTLLRFTGIFLIYVITRNLFVEKIGFHRLLNAILISGFFPVIVGIIQYIFKLGLNINDAHRIYGSFTPHPVGFAFYLQILILVAIYMFLYSGSYRYIFFTLILGFLLIHTNTRLVFVTTCLSIGIIILLKKHYKLFAVSSILTILYLIFIQKSLIYRLLSTFNMDSSTKFRYFIYNTMEPLMKENLIFGSGLGNFAYIFEELTGIDRVAPHNDYFGILFEVGVIGLVIYLILQLCIILQLGYKIKNNNPTKLFLIFVTLMVFINTNIFGFLSNPNNYYEIQLYVWMIIGSTFGLLNNKSDKKDLNLGLVGSSGGHLMQLYQLEDWWNKHDRFWVTFDKQDSRSLLKEERKYWCYHPTNRNVKNLIRNTFLAIKILFKERPDVIISTGAAPAIPFYYIGKLLGAKLIYVEVYDRIDLPTLTGKIVYPITDKFILQWEDQKKHYPKGEVLGGVL